MDNQAACFDSKVYVFRSLQGVASSSARVSLATGAQLEKQGWATPNGNKHCLGYPST